MSAGAIPAALTARARPEARPGSAQRTSAGGRMQARSDARFSSRASRYLRCIVTL